MPSTPKEVYMQARQITLPFRLRDARPRKHQNADLIGRSYVDGEAMITVTDVCPGSDGRVMVERDLDGRTWSMPAWLMRLIFMEGKRKRAA
jgi:hypothetical protein